MKIHGTTSVNQIAFTIYGAATDAVGARVESLMDSMEFTSISDFIDGGDAYVTISDALSERRYPI